MIGPAVTRPNKRVTRLAILPLGRLNTVELIFPLIPLSVSQRGPVAWVTFPFTILISDLVVLATFRSLEQRYPAT